MIAKYGRRAVAIFATLIASVGLISGAIFLGHQIGREMRRWHGGGALR